MPPRHPLPDPPARPGPAAGRLLAQRPFSGRAVPASSLPAARAGPRLRGSSRPRRSPPSRCPVGAAHFAEVDQWQRTSRFVPAPCRQANQWEAGWARCGRPAAVTAVTGAVGAARPRWAGPAQLRSAPLPAGAMELGLARVDYLQVGRGCGRPAPPVPSAMGSGLGRRGGEGRRGRGEAQGGSRCSRRGPGRPLASAPEAGGCAAPGPPQRGRDTPPRAAAPFTAPARSPVPAAGAEARPLQERVFRQVGVTAQKTMRLLPASGRKATQKVVAVAAQSLLGSSRCAVSRPWRGARCCC